MANYDCTYTNSASTVLSFNAGVYLLQSIKGIYAQKGKTASHNIPLKEIPSLYVGTDLVERDIELTVVVKSSTVVADAKAIADALWVDQRDDARGTLTFTAGTGVARSILCAPEDDVTFDGLDDEVPGAPVIAHIKLRCHNTLPYNATPTTVTGAFSGATPVTLECINGTARAWPTITYTQGGSGSTTNPKVTDAYGYLIEVEGTLVATAVLVIVSSAEGLTITHTLSGASTSWFAKRSTDSRLVAIKHGTNNLTFTCTAGGDAAISVVFNPRYGGMG